MTKIHWSAWLSLGVVLAGCYGSRGNTKEGQSHWLTRCDASSDCPEDLSCACGVCTIACTTDAICDGTGTCVRVADEPSCGEVSLETSAVCLATCTIDEDCEASGLICSAGSCIAEPEAQEPDAQAPEDEPPPPLDGCEEPLAFEPLEPVAGEVCYELAAHNGSGTEPDPFLVPSAESISQFYYAIPWPAGSVATRYGARFDNLGVLRQWLLFSTGRGEPGTVSRNVTGSTLGEDAEVLAGWGAGGCSVTLPRDMGAELPDPESGRVLMVQWHYLNEAAEARSDASRVQICVVPRSERANIGSLTVLGTEDLGSPGMPPNSESTFDGACANGASEPVTVVAFRPSMHAIGTYMRSDVERADGDIEPVFAAPFADERQAHYLGDPFVVLQPGDTLRSECTYFNDTTQPVSFGPSVSSEVCFQYAYAYPAGALDKPEMTTLLGATNTCWGD